LLIFNQSLLSHAERHYHHSGLRGCVAVRIHDFVGDGIYSTAANTRALCSQIERAIVDNDDIIHCIAIAETVIRFVAIVNDLPGRELLNPREVRVCGTSRGL